MKLLYNLVKISRVVVSSFLYICRSQLTSKVKFVYIICWTFSKILKTKTLKGNFKDLLHNESNNPDRFSRSQMFFKIGLLKNFITFTGKQLCWSFNLIKKRLQYRCFPVNIVKYLRTAFL